ncbi:MAG TPA: hypothetical protein VLV16_02980 [Gemmatimonadales bacterium]|nr:hypothetical protein [Gemmatimonadales bacterium]
MSPERDVQAQAQPHDVKPKASYETPVLKTLGKIGDLTLGVPSPQVDVLFVGSL